MISVKYFLIKPICVVTDLRKMLSTRASITRHVFHATLYPLYWHFSLSFCLSFSHYSLSLFLSILQSPFILWSYLGVQYKIVSMRAMLVRCLCWTPMISNFFWISFVWDLFKCTDIDIYHRSFARNIVFLQSDWHTNCASIIDTNTKIIKKTHINMTEINMVPTIPPQIEEPPMSRTHQYRKVMKPLLERKRRARINKCLDDIKDLLIDSLQVNWNDKNVVSTSGNIKITMRQEIIMTYSFTFLDWIWGVNN